MACADARFEPAAYQSPQLDCDAAIAWIARDRRRRGLERGQDSARNQVRGPHRLAMRLDRVRFVRLSRSCATEHAESRVGVAVHQRAPCEIENLVLVRALGVGERGLQLTLHACEHRPHFVPWIIRGAEPRCRRIRRSQLFAKQRHRSHAIRNRARARGGSPWLLDQRDQRSFRLASQRRRGAPFGCVHLRQALLAQLLEALLNRSTQGLREPIRQRPPQSVEEPEECLSPYALSNGVVALAHAFVGAHWRVDFEMASRLLQQRLVAAAREFFDLGESRIERTRVDGGWQLVARDPEPLGKRPGRMIPREHRPRRPPLRIVGIGGERGPPRCAQLQNESIEFLLQLQRQATLGLLPPFRGVDGRVLRSRQEPRPTLAGTRQSLQFGFDRCRKLGADHRLRHLGRSARSEPEPARNQRGRDRDHG